MNKKLKGKIALVTGGSRGIGFSCAMKLAEQGASVFLASSNAERLQKASEIIGEKKVGEGEPNEVENNIGGEELTQEQQTTP